MALRPSLAIALYVPTLASSWRRIASVQQDLRLRILLILGEHSNSKAQCHVFLSLRLQMHLPFISVLHDMSRPPRRRFSALPRFSYILYRNNLIGHFLYCSHRHYFPHRASEVSFSPPLVLDSYDITIEELYP